MSDWKEQAEIQNADANKWLTECVDLRAELTALRARVKALEEALLEIESCAGSSWPSVRARVVDVVRAALSGPKDGGK